jgi:hypothetical protein
MMIRTYPFGWLTSFVTEDIRQKPEKLSLYMGLTRQDWHYAGLVLAVVEFHEDREALHEYLQDDLFTQKRLRILTSVGASHPRRMLKLLPKLRGDLWRPATYRRLMELCADEETYEFFKHRKSIQRKHVFWLMRLPDGFRHVAIIDRLQKGWKADEISFAISIVKHIRHDLSNEQILKSLSSYQGRSIQGWVMRHLRQLSFPECPWAGTNSIRPLRSFDELKRTALEFDNCIRTYLIKILRGNAYFYRYEKNGKGVAVVEVITLPAMGWVVNEALGPHNETLPHSVKREIAQAFSDGGITIPPMTIEPEYWLND